MALKRAVFVVASQPALQTTSCLLAAAARRSADLLRLLRQQNGLDVGQDAALGDRDARQQLVQLLVVADGQLEMTRDDARLLVVAGGVAGQLEHLGGQVLHDGCQVDGRSGTDALGIVTLAQQTVDTTDGELKTGATGSRLCLSLDFASLSTSRHDDDRVVVIDWRRKQIDSRNDGDPNAVLLYASAAE